jgi:hypothetical protein
MKYTRLTKEQFEIFHERFAKFLATQKIDKEEWKKIVETNPKLTEELLDLFSDIVWDGALSNANYLENVSEKQISVFNFEKEISRMITVEITGDLDIDLTSHQGMNKLFENIMSDKVNIYQGNKKISAEERNAEMFQLIREGCMITDDKVFTSLNNFINS